MQTSNPANTSTPRRVSRTAITVAVAATVIALAGCGASAPAALVTQSGQHGDALEAVYVLYTSDPLSKASTRDLKDINAAIAAKDLKQATPGDVRRAQREIRSRIDDLDVFIAKVRKANRKLKTTKLPDFAGGLEDDPANDNFAKAYADISGSIQRYTTADLAAAPIAITALERYLAFLEQWEEFLIDDDTDGLVEAGEKSDAAYAKLARKGRQIKRREDLNKKIGPLVEQMAGSASDSSQLTDLVEQVKKQYPDSFLAKHLVEK
jgi:hypothetical protein